MGGGLRVIYHEKKKMSKSGFGKGLNKMIVGFEEKMGSLFIYSMCLCFFVFS